MNRRNAFTLLEVILASALAAVIMVAIGGAIQFFLIQVKESESSIEQTQVGRAVMALIERDLRSIAWRADIDFSSVEALAADTAGAGLDSATDLAADAGVDISGFDASSLQGNTEDLASSTVLPTTIGLFGNATELQIDISRIPRIDEYDPQYTGFRSGELGDIPSDVKTVTYFLLLPGTSNLGHGTVGDAGITEVQFGLVRRELDRAITQYAMNEGNIDALDASAEIIAPEVSLINFRYYDGLEWWEEWDSEEMGGLPMAVEVVMAIRPYDQTQALLTGQNVDTDIAEENIGQVFRQIIRIPVAQPIDTTIGETEEELPL